MLLCLPVLFSLNISKVEWYKTCHKFSQELHVEQNTASIGQEEPVKSLCWNILFNLEDTELFASRLLISLIDANKFSVGLYATLYFI